MNVMSKRRGSGEEGLVCRFMGMRGVLLLRRSAVWRSLCPSRTVLA